MPQFISQSEVEADRAAMRRFSANQRARTDANEAAECASAPTAPQPETAHQPRDTRLYATLRYWADRV